MDQICFVEHQNRFSVHVLRRNQITIQQSWVRCRLWCKDHEHQIDIGCDRAQPTLAVRAFQHVASRDECVDDAGIGGRRPQHFIPRNGCVEVRTQVAEYALAGIGLNQCLLGEACDDQAGFAFFNSITLGVRALRLNTFCLPVCKASLCHRASVCHTTRDGPQTHDAM